MKISAVVVDNFKRISHVEIAPDADRVLMLIGGRNAQGKSSLLDALTAAFGGKNALPSDAVKHGAEAAEIRVELDGGAFVVRRTIQSNGESVLEVRDGEGKVRSPQAMLDKIVAARFLDPLEFLSMSAADQRKTLLSVIDRDGKIAALDVRRVRVFDRRTEIGRDAKKAAVELERLPEVTVAEAIDVAALRAHEKDLDAKRAEIQTVKHDSLAADRELDLAEKTVLRLEAQLADIAEQLDQAENHRNACRGRADEARATWAGIETEATDFDADRTKLRAELDKAAGHNAQVAGDRERAKHRANVAADAERLAGSVATLTAEIEKIDAEKVAFLTSTALPVKGLDVDASGVKFNGVPFSQASGAEQLRVALALAIAASPNLRDVWVRDGSLLDEESLATLAAEAEAIGTRVWVERVGDRDPGAIVIHDGRLRDEHRKSA